MVPVLVGVLGLAACAELTAVFAPVPEPLLATSVEKPVAVLLLEYRGLLVPFVCGGEEGIARGRACASKVAPGTAVRTANGEGLGLFEVGWADCGAGDALKTKPPPAHRAVALWSDGGNVELQRPRGQSELPTGRWQRLKPDLEAFAARELEAEAESADMTGWISAEIDGDRAADLLLTVETTTKRAIVLVHGATSKIDPILVEDVAAKTPAGLSAAVDLDGDGVSEFLVTGDVWTLYHTPKGKPPAPLTSWFCYRRGGDVRDRNPDASL